MADSEIQNLKDEIEKLKKEKDELKREKDEPKEITWKVSEKGALSIYGLNRLPVTLYANQWAIIFEKESEIKKFIKDNDSKLKKKDR